MSAASDPSALPVFPERFPESSLGTAGSRQILWANARAALFLLLIWAGIYLPTLGSLELKGEEGRRMMPGQTMLRNGDWVVPQVGGEVYLRKPPMINWLAAISFRVTGVENEWTGRLPSVIGVLGMVLAVFLASRRWLGMQAAFAAAVFTMTNLAMMEKGRLLEIDALYSVATGLAIVFWCRLQMLDAAVSSWRNWLAIGGALAFGYLLKGPVHLLFFYAAVSGVLWKAGEMRKLFTLPHLVALLFAGGLIALWLVPYHQRTAGQSGQMISQLTDRLDGSDFHLTGWLLNIPRGLGNLLPWAVFLPFAWCPLRLQTPEKMRSLQRGLRLGVLVSFLIVSLAPGSLPRYTMPVTVPFALLLAISLEWGELPPGLWKIWRIATGGGVGDLRVLALRSGVVMVFCVAIYSLVAVPRLKTHSLWQATATRMNRLLPSGAVLYAVDPGSQPIFFYLRGSSIFIDKADDLPRNARYVLARGKSLTDVRKHHPEAQELLRYDDRGEKTSLLLKIEPKK